jgi:anthranilate phosphoribosyltransferase
MAWRPQFLEFCSAKLRKAKPQYGHISWSFRGAKTPNVNAAQSAAFTSARDRSGIFALPGQKLERIARFFAEQKMRPKKQALRNWGFETGDDSGAWHRYKECYMIKEAIAKAARREDLGYDMTEAVMDEIMGGKASDIQMAAYLTAMAVKGETIEEITASAAGMRKHCIRILHDMDVLEIVGTGGDFSNSFNISTTSAMVISAAGIPVAKHGNRAASSKSGAADVLESLGVDITISPERSLELLRGIGLCFLFAQNYHISMKYVAPVRKELGIRTIFNILGPLVNPAGANMELLGVYDADLIEPMARVLANLGVKSGLVVHGQDGFDEISVSAPTSVCELRNGIFKSYTIEPEQFGLRRCNKEDLTGGSPADNAAITRAVLSGEGGPKRDAVLLNSAAAIYIARPGLGMDEAVKIAGETIDSGRALAQLEKFIALSTAPAEAR